MSLNDNILEKLNRSKERLQQIENDLLLEEVMLDKKLTIRLEKERKSLLPIVNTFDDYISGNINLEGKLVSILADNDRENQSIAVEILPIKSDGGKIVELLNSVYKDVCEKEKFEFEKTQNGFTIFGEGSYDLFAGENGIHKTATQKVNVIIYPLFEKEEVSFGDEDIKIETFHSNGAGGQNVNKVETAIKITHKKTGVFATCQDERSQFQNKEKALKILKEKVLKKVDNDFEKVKRNEREKHQSKEIIRTYDFSNGVVFSDKETMDLMEFSNGGLIKILKSRLI